MAWLYTQSWIQQKQPVEFDGFGYTMGYMIYSLGCTVEYWIQQKQPVEFDGFGYTWLHDLFAGLYCGVLNPTKAAGGVWWIWLYMATWSIRWAMYCGVLNPTKAAGGVWWIWLYMATWSIRWAVLWSTESNKSSRWSLMDLVIHGYMIYSLGYVLWSTESNKSSRWSLMDLVYMATWSIRWAVLWSTESNKSSRWSLMDLVYMATWSIRWAVLWSTEYIKSSRWSLMDLVIHGYMIYSLGCTVEYWIQQKQPLKFDGFGIHGYMIYSLGCTVEYWIQQKQPLKFDGFGIHGYMIYSLGCTWSTESNKSSRWSLMDLVYMATWSIRWAVLWSTESNKSSRWSLMDLVIHGYMIYSLGCTVEYWIQQKQPVEFDGFGYTWLHDLFAGLYCGVLNPTKAAGGVWWIWLYMATWSIRWAVLWSTESNKSSRWSLMDLVIHGYMIYSLGCTVEYWIQQKQPVEFDGFGYTWLHDLFAGLYCGVLNPTKAAGGVWWIWLYMATWSIRWAVLWSTESNKSSRWSLMDLVTHGYMIYSLGCTVEYWIQQKQPVEFDGFGYTWLHDSIRWAVLWSTESNKSSRWSLMDLVTHGYMIYSLGCTVEYWIQQKQPVEFDGFGYTWLHDLFAGLYCGVLNPTKAAGGVWWIWLYMATWSIRWAVLWSTESNKSSRWSLMDLVIHGYMIYSLGCTVEYWIQQNQAVRVKTFYIQIFFFSFLFFELVFVWICIMSSFKYC